MVQLDVSRKLFRLVVVTALLPLLIGSAMGQVDTSAEATSSSDAEVKMDFLDAGTVPTSIAQLREMEKMVADIFEKVKPATVNIRVGMGQGTGVVISRDGYILTAAHVINGPDRAAFVTFPDGKQYRAETLGVDPALDSGMLKLVDKRKKRWPFIELGESDGLTNGQWVVAIGHPGGIDLKRGLVLRVGRIVSKRANVLRTDCTLVGGDSGGPLVNMAGELIGIHSRIGNSLSDNLHVPADVFSVQWDQLANGDIVGRKALPYLGINILENSTKLESVAPGGPAAKAGMRPNDVIKSVDGEEVKNKIELGRILRKLKPKQKVKITVERLKRRKKDSEEKPQVETKEFEVTVGRR